MLEVLPPTTVSHQLLINKLTPNSEADYKSDLAAKKEELSFIKAVNFTEYRNFGKWVIEVMGKKN